MQKEIFGQTASGETVERVTLSAGGLTARIMTYGATIQDLRLEGHAAPLVLGFDRLEDYERHSPYFGVTPGRCSNRIAGGAFTLDGKPYRLERNEKDVNHLHGGSDGIAKRNWQIIGLSSDSVTLAMTDPDGRAGYPGNCRITATYQLRDEGVLSVVYESETDQPTLANICQHAYFNLDGGADILGHDLMIAADHYLPVDDVLIPTGEIRPVDGTPFDFREMRPIRRQVDGTQVPYDHNFCLSPTRMQKRSVALARSINSGVTMEVRTTEPGVQFYAGVYVNVPVPGLEGKTYGPYAGFCLETQVWPDAINHAAFPSPVLRPGQVLRQETDYVFSRI
ncbi:galactose mutarotase [Rhizobium cremeum]|uniref:aldose epimerase family protein n=1 Tax=Rhizobium cremeum TaxID=2813827 RepID=UPI000DDE4002|nr:aldose epimerase family protein [Rhizobium cremeum]MCJ7994494.1 galactose mutarotase [Rhizobium cremeum]MCJ7999993.1 galactose mutarotase [Rhizobium cremeum]